nr:putative toxin-antitoxin system toxin component, PIN family [uncultured Rhodoferax sp.]
MLADRRLVILDTNIVLDTFVFNDPAAKPLRQALEAGTLQWIATVPMREELERVLAYPKIAKRLAFYAIQAADVLAQFDTRVQTADVAPKAPIVCKDPDDQKFIDLAVAHKALVLSKDNAVLCMKKRLLTLGAQAQVAMEIVANAASHTP